MTDRAGRHRPALGEAYWNRLLNQDTQRAGRCFATFLKPLVGGTGVSFLRGSFLEIWRAFGERDRRSCGG